MLWVSLSAWIVVCLIVGTLGTRWTAPAIPGWYSRLRKPSFSPPNWVFAPVWTTLYILMAVAAWRVTTSPATPDRGWALDLFILQLALNLVWSWIFFGRRALGAALAEVLVLWAAIAATIAVSARVDALAAWLLVPYLAWVSFASLLNAAIWRLNSPAKSLARTATQR